MSFISDFLSHLKYKNLKEIFFHSPLLENTKIFQVTKKILITVFRINNILLNVYNVDCNITFSVI